MRRRRSHSRSRTPPARSHRRPVASPPPRRWTGSSSSSSSSSFGSTSGGRNGARGRRGQRWTGRPRGLRRGRGAFHSSPPSSDNFTMLRVSGIRHGVSIDFVKDTLRRELRGFDFKTSIVDEGREQTAYLYFDAVVDAEDAVAAHPRVCFDTLDDPFYADIELIMPNVRSFSRNRRSTLDCSSYPDYLRHVPPEDDPLASRTLFLGNLDVTVTQSDLDVIFSRFGLIKDIDIKRPLQPGQGNAFAFIRFETLDMAHKAKLEMSGQYIGKHVCKIGYGKPNATPKVYIGGLGEWVSVELLEREFDRFGAIRKLQLAPNSSYAYVEYDSVDAAIAAVDQMRGFPLGGPERRVRVDYVDLDAGIELQSETSAPPSPEPERRSPMPPDTDILSESSPKVTEEPVITEDGTQQPVLCITDAAHAHPSSWRGAVILKTSIFAAQLHHLEGDAGLIASLATDGHRTLRMNQRLKLDPVKLGDIERGLASRPSWAIYLALPTSTTGLDPLLDTTGKGLQVKPFKSLVVYLKSKEAAGIVVHNGANEALAGLVYVFPPCDFSASLLAKQGIDCSVNDHVHGNNYLVVVAASEFPPPDH